jgi:hypothetical protein
MTGQPGGQPTEAWVDSETTSLRWPDRRAWDVAAIIRHPGQPDIEHQWFIHPVDLRLVSADPEALDIGGFWTRHPHAEYLRAGGNPLYAPDLPGVYRSREALRELADATAGGTIICGSNPDFDKTTLAGEMSRWSITPTWYYRPEDVPTLVKGWLYGRGLPQPVPRTSDAYCRAIGINPDLYARHTALGDCRLFRDTADTVTGLRPHQGTLTTTAGAPH